MSEILVIIPSKGNMEESRFIVRVDSDADWIEVLTQIAIKSQGIAEGYSNIPHVEFRVT